MNLSSTTFLSNRIVSFHPRDHPGSRCSVRMDALLPKKTTLQCIFHSTPFKCRIEIVFKISSTPSQILKSLSVKQTLHLISADHHTHASGAEASHTCRHIFDHPILSFRQRTHRSIALCYYLTTRLRPPTLLRSFGDALHQLFRRLMVVLNMPIDAADFLRCCRASPFAFKPRSPTNTHSSVLVRSPTTSLYFVPCQQAL